MCRFCVASMPVGATFLSRDQKCAALVAVLVNGGWMALLNKRLNQALLCATNKRPFHLGNCECVAGAPFVKQPVVADSAACSITKFLSKTLTRRA
jgi:hypothetical protein